MRVLAAVSLLTLLGGCAFSRQVERFGVEYNTALAGMNNEQTLLNILRAKDGMPTHFTSVSQFRGNLSLTASASLNGQLRGDTLTNTLVSGFSNTVAGTSSTSSVAGASPTITTTASTVTTPVTSGSTTSAMGSGGDLYTPQVSGQLVSGTAFDVAVFDTQKFYQGITTSIPFSTIETLLNRGMNNRLLMALTIARVDVLLDEDAYGHKRGERFFTIVNDPTDPVSVARFQNFLNCYELGAKTTLAVTTNLVAISRLTHGPDGKPMALPIDKMTVLDGEKFGLSGDAIGSDPENDKDIFMTRLTGPKEAPRLSQRSPEQCRGPGDRVVTVAISGRQKQLVVPNIPSQEALFAGDDIALIYANGDIRPVKAIMNITFRSPEGLFTFIGEYLAREHAPRITVEGHPLFTITEGRSRDALAQARYRGRYYSLVNDPATGTQNAQIFTLMQQLVNLHKEAADRPSAIPVRAVP